MLKRILVLFALFWSQVVASQESALWFTGYNYNGSVLAKASIQTLTQRVLHLKDDAKLEACVALANKAYITNNHKLLFNTLDYAIAYCIANRGESTGSNLFLLYNLKAERLVYAGRYLEAYEVVKNTLKVVPNNHVAEYFLRYNRIKILAKSIPPGNIIGIENQLTELAAFFLSIKAFTPYIETSLMHQQNFPELYPLSKLEEKLQALPEPYKSEGLMNLYYYTGSQNPDYLFAAKNVTPSNYLAYFRLNIGIVEYYYNQDSFELANEYLKKAHAVVGYLGDHEVNRHYAQYYLLMKEKLPQEKLAIRINVNPINYDYKEQFFASKSVASDLLKEAKIEIERERSRNQLFIKWLLLMLLVVLVLLILVFYGFKKLKQSTTYNNWITTALSHDLRSPVSHILYALDRDNGVYLAKSNLISYEYLLDDTLNMAVYVHGNQKPVFKLIDLTELVDELLQDLNYIITNKQLVVENKLSAEMIVNGDFNGLKILLRNVLLNAIKHNKEGGYIRIESAKKEAAGLTIENSVDSKTMSSKPTAGSQIIQFFAKQNKANYQFKMESDKAVALVVFG